MRAIKDIPKVKLTLKPGKLSPAQENAKKRFWQKLISEVKASER